jgi:cell division protein FtsI (penicillin-binding protein 3)/stage V sporulation protein D (sporulation-specific penicillin-binding protein)
VSGSAKVRALVACSGLAVCFTLFSARLVHLQVTMGQEYTAKAAQKHVDKVPIYAKRGTITDLNGELLAQNEPIHTVVADGSLISDKAALAHLLAGPLGMDEARLTEKLSTQRESKTENKKVPSQYIVLKTKVPESVAAEIRTGLLAQKLRGVRFEPDSERVYPNGQMLCHVVGYVNSDNTGVEGIERNLEEYLRGHDGYRYIERDRTGRELVPYRGQERAPRDGHHVRLTIDMAIQQIVESELDAAVKQFRPKMATCILMRPQTGEILALANRPNFDLNSIEQSTMDARRNRAITDMVEPGSTFKIVTTAAALTQKLVRPDSYVFCENGAFSWGGRVLHDHRGYGDLNIHDILVHSSNIGVAKLGIQLGEQRLYEAIRKFGFGERTGINLPGEIAGVVHPPHRWSKVSITHVPMGHEVGATPMQVVAAMGAIANGGTLMMPQIVHSILDPEGTPVQVFQKAEVRRVASAEALKTVREALVQVVSKKGTAALAHVPGYTVAGKTGTAQKVGANGKYESKYVVSFAGFMPAENPEFVALVMLDEAQTPPHQNYGGLVAAPIFSRIGERTARYLNLTPSPEEPGGNIVVTQADRIRD